MHVDHIRLLTKQSITQALYATGRVDARDEGSRLSYKRIATTLRRTSEESNLMSQTSEHDGHPIDHRLLTRVATVVIMYD